MYFEKITSLTGLNKKYIFEVICLKLYSYWSKVVLILKDCHFIILRTN